MHILGQFDPSCFFACYVVYMRRRLAWQARGFLVEINNLTTFWRNLSHESIIGSYINIVAVDTKNKNSGLTRAAWLPCTALFSSSIRMALYHLDSSAQTKLLLEYRVSGSDSLFFALLKKPSP